MLISNGEMKQRRKEHEKRVKYLERMLLFQAIKSNKVVCYNYFLVEVSDGSMFGLIGRYDYNLISLTNGFFWT